MEGRIVTKVVDYHAKFKSDVCSKIAGLEIAQNDKQQLMQFIYDYDQIGLTKDDFLKRKRVKNVVPFCDRCMARRAEAGEQCTRKRRAGELFCGTHIKGTPHGVVQDNVPTVSTTKQIEVTAREIQGIIYYIDDVENVYKTEDVMQNKSNPQIIAKYVKLESGEYSIPDFNI